MKDNLTVSEVARVFAIYMGCGVQHEGRTGKNLGCILWDMDSYAKVYFDVGMHSTELQARVEEVKLILKPVSSIGNEDLIEIAAILYNEPHIKQRPNIQSLIEYTKLTLPDRMGDATCWQLLLERGYAVPLHPWNKTAIELGLAVPSTT